MITPAFDFTRNRYIIFANDLSVSSLNRGDIVVNALFVTAYVPLVFFVKKTFGWLFFRFRVIYFEPAVGV
jgi:hypothetical protein